MSSSESKVSPPQAPEPAALPVAALPDWAPVYLKSLRATFHKPEATRAAGVDIIDVIRLRKAHPDFAAQEHEILSAFPELLEAEAFRRATTVPTPGPDGKVIRPLGSDRLLLRLMEHYIPGFARAKNSAPSRNSPANPEPAAPDPIETAAAQNPPFPEALLREFPFLRPIRYPKPSDVRDLQNHFVSLYGRARLLDQRREFERKESDKLRKEQQAARAERDQLKHRTRKLEEALTAARVPIPASDTISIDEKTRALWLRPAGARPALEDDEGPAPSSFAPITDRNGEAESESGREWPSNSGSAPEDDSVGAPLSKPVFQPGPPSRDCVAGHPSVHSQPTPHSAPQSVPQGMSPRAPGSVPNSPQNSSSNLPPPSNHDYCYKSPKRTLYHNRPGRGPRDARASCAVPARHPP